jgi:anti-sigma B factor antagonist
MPVVTAPDQIDVANAEALGDTLEAASADHPTIIVNMTRNVFCDSSGLRMLIMAVRRARAAGGELRLVLSQPHLRRVFKVTGLDRVIKISGTLAEAAAAALPTAAGRQPEPPDQRRPGIPGAVARNDEAYPDQYCCLIDYG